MHRQKTASEKPVVRPCFSEIWLPNASYAWRNVTKNRKISPIPRTQLSGYNTGLVGRSGPRLFGSETEMRRTLLKSKIHRARVTEAELHYVGSVTIDRDLMDAADILDHEQVQIYNITNGSRLTTYAIEGEPGSGTICINGAAAHLVDPDDLVIITSYAEYEEDEAQSHHPRVLLVDESNRVIEPASANSGS